MHVVIISFTRLVVRFLTLNLAYLVLLRESWGHHYGCLGSQDAFEGVKLFYELSKHVDFGELSVDNDVKLAGNCMGCFDSLDFEGGFGHLPQSSGFSVN